MIWLYIGAYLLAGWLTYLAYLATTRDWASARDLVIMMLLWPIILAWNTCGWALDKVAEATSDLAACLVKRFKEVKYHDS